MIKRKNKCEKNYNKKKETTLFIKIYSNNSRKIGSSSIIELFYMRKYYINILHEF